MKTTNTLLLLSLTTFILIFGCVSQETRSINETFDKMGESLGTSAYVRNNLPLFYYENIPEFISSIGNARFNLTANQNNNEFILII